MSIEMTATWSSMRTFEAARPGDESGARLAGTVPRCFQRCPVRCVRSRQDNRRSENIAIKCVRERASIDTRSPISEAIFR